MKKAIGANVADLQPMQLGWQPPIQSEHFSQKLWHVRLNRTDGSAAATQEWAEIAVEWFSYEVGSDSDLVAEMRAIAVQPRDHPAWATRKRLKVGGLSRA